MQHGESNPRIEPKRRAPWRDKWYRIIFESDTPAGRLFDVVLMVAIILSVLTVFVESVRSIRFRFGSVLFGLEWAFTLLFSVEFALRIATAKKPMRYVFSFFGLVDILSILPTYLSLAFPGSQYFLSVRSLRLLRAFRVFKLSEFLREANVLSTALLASGRKIIVFLSTVSMLVVVIGSVMYMIEGEENGFTDIPTSIYWAIVTLTTVGYGDVSPHTPLGKALASLVMVLGYSIIAVPTGIVTVEMSQAKKRADAEKSCPQCGKTGHDLDARFCKHCGAEF